MENQGSNEKNPKEVRVRDRRLVLALWLMMIICVVQLIMLTRASRVMDEQIKIASQTGSSTTNAEVEPYLQSHPGPWGNLKFARITLEPPMAFIPAAANSFGPTEWFFEKFDVAKLNEFLGECGLSKQQLEALFAIGRVSNVFSGTLVYPDDDLLLNLPPAMRAKIYMELGRSRANTLHMWPVKAKSESVAAWFAEADLSPPTIKLLNQLVYRRSGYLCFSDLWVLYPRIKDQDERLRFIKFISRTPALLMKLQIKPDTDATQLAAYWAAGPRNKDIETLLESLKKVPGGITIDVAHLVTTFARKRLYTFPVPGNPDALSPNCSWTAMNFYNDTPDDRFYDETFWRNEMKTKYTQVYSPRLGDLMVLFRPDGEPIHVAVYIADDVVFTKNGGSGLHPWVFMKWADMISEYTMDFPPKFGMYRSKRFTE